jgi:hypothetical protein
LVSAFVNVVLPPSCKLRPKATYDVPAILVYVAGSYDAADGP